MGQKAIAETLTHALEQNRIAPAYLFCGPRGTGKTSSARILAKSLNCLNADGPTPKPCGKCDLCLSVSRGNALDIVEIDAASNTGVDNIRELIERAQFAPVQCRYKAYVIDECHMLSTAAFNALLKTLEEPPDRVVFVLATTDPQRVLPTIISRCQRFDFRRIPLPAMIKHLTYIAKKEDINIAQSALQLVAQISQGGLRDAESLLDQLSLQADEITVETVWDLVGAVPERDLLNLVRAIAADDGTVLIDRVRNLMDKGREPLIVLQSLVGFYRDLLIAKTAPKREDLVAITPSTWAEMTEFAQKLPATQLLASQQKLQTAEVQVKNTTQPRLWLEITLTSLLPSALGAIATSSESKVPTSVVVSVPTVSSSTSTSSVPTSPVNASPAANTSPALSPPPAEKVQPTVEADRSKAPAPDSQRLNLPKPSPVEPADSSADGISPAPPSADNNAPAASDPAFGNLADLWQKILAALEPRGTQMLMGQQGILLSFDGVGAKVGFKSASLQKMARERVPNLEKALASIFNRPIKVSLEVVSTEEAKATQANNASSPPVQKSPPPARPIQKSQPDFRQNDGRSSDSSPSHSQPPTDAASGAELNQAPSARSTEDSNNQASDKQSNQAPSSPADNGRATPPARPVDNLPSAPSSAVPGQWQTNQEQDNIKRFAQFFNGQIVDLDDSEPEPPGSDPDKKQKSSEPGPDVPF